MRALLLGGLIGLAVLAATAMIPRERVARKPLSFEHHQLLHGQAALNLPPGTSSVFLFDERLWPTELWAPAARHAAESGRWAGGGAGGLAAVLPGPAGRPLPATVRPRPGAAPPGAAGDAAVGPGPCGQALAGDGAARAGGAAARGGGRPRGGPRPRDRHGPRRRRQRRHRRRLHRDPTWRLPGADRRPGLPGRPRRRAAAHRSVAAPGRRGAAGPPPLARLDA